MLSEKEITELKNITTKYSEIDNTLNELQIEIKNIENKRVELLKEYEKTKSVETEVINKLTKKYGKDNITATKLWGYLQ